MHILLHNILSKRVARDRGKKVTFSAHYSERLLSVPTAVRAHEMACNWYFETAFIALLKAFFFLEVKMDVLSAFSVHDKM